MEHGTPTQKSDRDRIRQKRGSERKEQMREIRKITAAWKDGRPAESAMQSISDILAGRKPA